MFLDILYFIIATGILIFTAELIINALSNLAGYLRVNEFVLAFGLMAIATSIPELAVGVTSSLAGKGALTLGNIIGANLLNLTLVIGIPVLITGGMDIRGKELKKDSLYMFIIAALPGVLMLLGNELSRLDGVILLGTFVFYGWHTYKIRKEFHKKTIVGLSKWDVITNTITMVVGIPVLFFSAKYVIDYASNISQNIGLPPIFIGLFIVSIGTTLPELIVGIKAVQKKHNDIALGDMIGSVVTNSTLVIGVAALIHPIQANFFLFLTSSAFMLVAAFLFSTFTESGNRLYTKEGVAMIMLYVLFLIVQMNLKGFF